MKKRKPKLVRAPTREEIALGPRQRRALRELFEWERQSAKSDYEIGVPRCR